jgi:predicted glycogen debranching enzyme
MKASELHTNVWPQRSILWGKPANTDATPLLEREWLVANGLGGYASGTIAGVATRRYHGLLIAAVPVQGRTVMLNQLVEELRAPDGTRFRFGGIERRRGLEVHVAHLQEFQLQLGLPVWRYAFGKHVVEKRVFMVHKQNTVQLVYRLIEGSGPVRVRVFPAFAFRPHDAPLEEQLQRQYVLSTAGENRYTVSTSDYPPLHLVWSGACARFVIDWRGSEQLHHREEAQRGYGAVQALLRPGHLRAELTVDAAAATLTASTEPWEAVLAQSPDEALSVECRRRCALLEQARCVQDDAVVAELVLAADQFIVTPGWRVHDVARGRASGVHYLSVIAGYHWFTDWGRDTMISLEGLCLLTGRRQEAGDILRTFAEHIRDGLIPNMFPEGSEEGLYHTADATLWYFHALDRYLTATGDDVLLRQLLPRLHEIVQAHLQGTRFGIGVDPEDGLLRQGAEGYQLTWMDAKVDDWVVTPRRGKAVEINALWYNALRLLADWTHQYGDAHSAGALQRHAERAYASFNQRFWYEDGGYLYDVVDGEDGADDTAFRPNQVFAIALRHAVLGRKYWVAVMDAVRARLLTPVGLRSLAPGHPDYKPRYFGDLRARDAAYHQGTVWGWLIGPYLDAWHKLHPEDAAGARELLQGLVEHLGIAGVGSISEVFDAEPPYTPRACIAQAWSVAEVLRCWIRAGHCVINPDATQESPASKP